MQSGKSMTGYRCTASVVASPAIDEVVLTDIDLTDLELRAHILDVK